MNRHSCVTPRPHHHHHQAPVLFKVASCQGESQACRTWQSMEVYCASSGAARRRRDRRLQAWHRHVKVTVGHGARCTRSTTPHADRRHLRGSALLSRRRGPRSGSHGRLRGCPGSSPRVASLAAAAADGVDAAALSFLTAGALEYRRLEEEERQKERRLSRERCREVLKRKRKKRRKKKIPRCSLLRGARHVRGDPSVSARVVRTRKSGYSSLSPFLYCVCVLPEEYKNFGCFGILLCLVLLWTQVHTSVWRLGDLSKVFYAKVDLVSEVDSQLLDFRKMPASSALCAGLWMHAMRQSTQLSHNFTHFLHEDGLGPCIRLPCCGAEADPYGPVVSRRKRFLYYSTSTRWSMSSSCLWCRFHRCSSWVWLTCPLCARQVLVVTVPKTKRFIRSCSSSSLTCPSLCMTVLESRHCKTVEVPQLLFIDVVQLLHKVVHAPVIGQRAPCISSWRGCGCARRRQRWHVHGWFCWWRCISC